MNPKIKEMNNEIQKKMLALQKKYVVTIVKCGKIIDKANRKCFNSLGKTEAVMEKFGDSNCYVIKDEKYRYYSPDDIALG